MNNKQLAGFPPNRETFSRASQTDSAAFKAWFGDSKVVDADGMPLVVYHGTTESFNRFRSDKIGTSKNTVSDPENWRGFFFESDPDAAFGYASRGRSEGRNLMPVYLSVRNPAIGEGAFPMTPSEARSAGHDGMIRRTPSGSVEVVVFRPEQIKSAIGNRGTFDPTSPLLSQ